MIDNYFKIKKIIHDSSKSKVKYLICHNKTGSLINHVLLLLIDKWSIYSDFNIYILGFFIQSFYSKTETLI